MEATDTTPPYQTWGPILQTFLLSLETQSVVTSSIEQNQDAALISTPRTETPQPIWGIREPHGMHQSSGLVRQPNLRFEVLENIPFIDQEFLSMNRRLADDETISHKDVPQIKVTAPDGTQPYSSVEEIFQDPSPRMKHFQQTAYNKALLYPVGCYNMKEQRKIILSQLWSLVVQLNKLGDGEKWYILIDGNALNDCVRNYVVDPRGFAEQRARRKGKKKRKRSPESKDSMKSSGH